MPTTATNPQTGERFQLDPTTGQWTPMGPVAHQAPVPSVDNPVSLGALNAVPGSSIIRDILSLPRNLYRGAAATPDVLRNFIQQPAATAKGFVEGASEAATPARIGTLAAAGVPGVLPAMLVAGGAQSAADATRLATDAPNAPQGPGDFGGDVLEAMLAPATKGAPSAARTAATGVRRLATQATKPGVVGGTLGAIQGYRRDGVLGALEGAGEGYALGTGYGRLGRLADALKENPEATAVESAAKPIVESSAPDKPDIVNAGRKVTMTTTGPTVYNPGGSPDPNLGMADEQNLRVNPQTGQTFAGDSPEHPIVPYVGYTGYTVNAGGDAPVTPTILARDSGQPADYNPEADMDFELNRLYQQHLYNERAPYLTNPQP